MPGLIVAHQPKHHVGAYSEQYSTSVAGANQDQGSLVPDSGKLRVRLDQIMRSRQLQPQEPGELIRQLEWAETAAGIGSWSWNRKTGLMFWSRGLYQLLDYLPGEVEPAVMLVLDHTSARDHASVIRALRLMLSGRSCRVTFRVMSSNGAWRHLEAECHAVVHDEQVLGIVRDVTVAREAAAKIERQLVENVRAAADLEAQKVELEIANRALGRLASTDGLTGVHNHRAFQEFLSQELVIAMRYNRPLSIALIDVDEFKRVNDDLGHQAGDKVLQQFASIIQTSVRTADFVARYGGEEFAVIMPETDGKEALLAMERVRKAVQYHSWTSRSLTVTIGISSVSSAIRSASDLIAMADQALYDGKRAGRNRVRYRSRSNLLQKAIVQDPSAKESSPSEIAP